MKLSKIASLFLAGGLVIGVTGCWNNGHGGGENANSANASDAYVIAFSPDGNKSGIINVECPGGKTKNVLATVKGPKGYIEFNESVVGCTITIPDTAWVDTDLNGEFNASEDSLISMPLKTIVGKARFANPITTYAIEKNDTKLLQEAANFDPVEAYAQVAEGDIKAKNLLLVAEIVKNAVKLGADLKNDVDINVSAVINGDVNESDLDKIVNVKNVDKDLIKAKVYAVTELIKKAKKLGLDPNEIKRLAVQVSDKDAKVSDAIKALDINVSNDILDQFNDIDTNISDIKDKLPAKVVLPDNIKVGNKTIPVVDGKFNYKLETNDTTNISDFYNISIPTVVITQKNVTESNPITVSATATIKDSKGRYVTFKINEVEIYKVDNKTQVKIPSGTQILLTTNIASLKEAIGGDTVDTYTSNDLINNDFEVNVNTLINNLTANKDKINKALDKFNNYIKVINDYTIDIKIKGESGPEWFTNLPKNDEGEYEVKGSVSVVGSITPPQPDIPEINETTPEYNCDSNNDGINDGYWTDTPFGKVCKAASSNENNATEKNETKPAYECDSDNDGVNDGKWVDTPFGKVCKKVTE
jgi:post-segregation antitoxin (ccd killing protein)